MAKKKTNNYTKKIFWVLLIFILLLFGFMAISFCGLLSLFFIPEEELSDGNVAEIEITGPIMGESAGGMFASSEAVSKDIVELIEKANEDEDIEAILFTINSPGGGAVASAEIAEAIENSDKTTVALVREVGASGGYWIASSTDYIIAHELSITGSIGVIGSYLEFAGLLERYNISYQQLIAGDKKDLGIPFRELEEDEKEWLQDKLDKIHEVFIREVANNRGMSYNQVEILADGSFYLGSEALEVGLIDQLGGRDEVELYLEEKINATVEFKEYTQPKSFFESLAEIMYQRSFFVGKGIGSMLFEESFEVKV